MTEYLYFQFHDQGGDKNNREELNSLLEEGWIPVRETGLSCGSETAWIISALILLQREVESFSMTRKLEVFSPIQVCE